MYNRSGTVNLRLKRAILIALALIAFGLIIIGPLPVLAQTSTPTSTPGSWSCTLNLTVSNPGFLATYNLGTATESGQWTSGTGVTTRDVNAGGGVYWRWFHMYYSLPNGISGSTIEGYTAVWDITKNTAYSGSFFNISVAGQSQSLNNSSAVDGLNTVTVGGIGSGISLTTSIGGTFYIEVSAKVDESASPAGAVALKSITLVGTGSPICAPATPTPTPSPTPTITAGSVAQQCSGLIDQDTANFASLPARWVYTEEQIKNPDGATQGLEFPLGFIQTYFTGKRYFKYTLTINYHVTTAQDGAFIYIQIGRSPKLEIPIPNGSTAPQSFTFPAANYEPSEIGSATDKFILLLTQNPDGTKQNPTLVLDYICISTDNSSQTAAAAPVSLNGDPDQSIGQVGSTTGSVSVGYNPSVTGAYCTIPSSELLGTDTFRFTIVYTWNCAVKPVVYGIWQTGVNLGARIEITVFWFQKVFEGWLTWVKNVIYVMWFWFTGGSDNLMIALGNGVAKLINLMGLGNLANRLITTAQSVSNTVQTVFAMAEAAIAIIGYFADRLINLVLNLIMAFPQVVGSIIAGFNSSSYDAPAWAFLCNSNNQILYAPCLSMYVIDNTLLNGPAYYIMPIVIAGLGYETLVWAMEYIKENLR